MIDLEPSWGGGPGGADGHHLACCFEEQGPRQLDWVSQPTITGQFCGCEAFSAHDVRPKQQLPSAAAASTGCWSSSARVACIVAQKARKDTIPAVRLYM